MLCVWGQRRSFGQPDDASACCRPLLSAPFSACASHRFVSPWGFRALNGVCVALGFLGSGSLHMGERPGPGVWSWVSARNHHDLVCECTSFAARQKGSKTALDLPRAACSQAPEPGARILQIEEGVFRLLETLLKALLGALVSLQRRTLLEGS